MTQDEMDKLDREDTASRWGSQIGEKYIAKKYVTTASVVDTSIKCPNCHQPMIIGLNAVYCYNSDCKLNGIRYREVKSLTTIERMDDSK